MSTCPERQRMARIRCLQECIETFKNCTEPPKALCYVPKMVEYKVMSTVTVNIYEEPSPKSKLQADLSCNGDTLFYASGEELSNSYGQWIRIHRCVLVLHGNVKEMTGWLCIWDSKKNSDDPSHFVRLVDLKNGMAKQSFLEEKAPTVISWYQVIEETYYFRSGTSVQPEADVEAVNRLRHIPHNWTKAHDEEMARFLVEETKTSNEQLGSIKNYVESIDVSSCCDEDEGPTCLTDGDVNTFWESDGNQGSHWIKLSMKKGTILKKLFVVLDGSDDNYMPSHIVTMCGEADDLKKLNEVHIDVNISGVQDVCVLDEMTVHYPLIEIRVKECKDDGIDTRIRGIKIKSSQERDIGLSIDIFNKEIVHRFPKLDGYEPHLLFRRALVIQRFTILLDSVIQYVVPDWDLSLDSIVTLKEIKHILPLSKKRMSLIDTFLRESETPTPGCMPKLFINRQSAADHKADPSLDPDCSNSILNQMYKELRPKNRLEKDLDYRWSCRYDQWWECKFMSEGIIDQGGGFRDSLADLGDELCPTDPDCPVPLPYFIRSPNQNQDENINRDVYIPNSSCDNYTKYRWIGQLMGACFRGKESLVLFLPSYIWKKLLGSDVTWQYDFISVDRAEVKVMETMEMLDSETFDALFGEDRTWTVTLSDGSVLPLKENGAECKVAYNERLDYISKVKEARMRECDKQICAIHEGLVSVLPPAVLDLISWKELEKRICGDPEITVDSLKKSTHYEDVEQTESRITHLWEALTNFSNDERSRFLRFVTGRRRLPATLYICPDKGESPDALPESSTCSNTLYLPDYASAKVAEEKLRYASYHCIAIDTDMSTWDD